MWNETLVDSWTPDSLQKLGRFLDLLPIGSMVIDKKSRTILHVNQIALQMIQGEEQSTVGRLCHDFVCPSAFNSCPIIDLGQEIDHSERILLTCSGKQIPIIKTVKQIMIGEKEVLLETFVDISRIRESERHLEFIKYCCDNAEECIVCVNSVGRYLYANNASKELLGYSELTDKYIWDINNTYSDRDQWADFWEKLRHCQRLKYQANLRAKNGNFIPLEVTGRQVTIGDHSYFWAFGQDIRERLKNEEVNIQKDSAINILLDAMPCILRSTDKDLRFTSSLGAGLRELGQAPNEVVGLTISEYNRIYDASIPIELYRSVLMGQCYSNEQTDPSDGRTFLNHIKPLYDSTQMIQGTITVSLDISELQKARHLVDSKNKTISKLISEYVRAQEKEREWTALEIHDRIIQPLITILHQIESVKELDWNQDIGNLMIEDVRNAINESRNLIKQLYPPTLSKFGLGVLIKEELEFIQQSSGLQYNLDINIDTNSLKREYETTLYRVFHEALLNVQKHAQAKAISIYLKQDDHCIDLVISDDGRGFDYEWVRSLGNIGGLQSMRDRIGIIGGAFSLSSTPEFGTTIKATIPLTKDFIT